VIPTSSNVFSRSLCRLFVIFVVSKGSNYSFKMFANQAFYDKKMRLSYLHNICWFVANTWCGEVLTSRCGPRSMCSASTQ